MATRKTSAAQRTSPRTGALKMSSTAIGTTGLRQWGGFIDEEFHKDLRGTKATGVYREMSDNDAIVGAIVFAVTMLMRQSTWSWTAANETPDAETAKDFAEEVFKKMRTPIEDVIDEACSMFTYGYAAMEIIWLKRDDGAIGVDSIQLRAQPTIYRWAIDDIDGTIDGLWQQPWSGPQVFIPIEKMLLFRTTTQRNNPEGRSMLRTAYRAWRNKKRIEDIEGIGIERDLAGLPVGRLPGKYFSADADPDEQAVLNAWKALVTRVRIDTQQGIVLPSDTDAKGHPLYGFELLGGKGSRAMDTTKIVERYDKQIATSVLADFIFLGQGSRGQGSFALSSDKTAMFSSAIGGFLKAIASVFNRHLMPRLWRLNAFDPDLMPTLKPGDVETQDLDKLAMFITALAGAGMALFPDRELENHLRSEAGLPGAPEDSDSYEGPPLPIAGPRAATAIADHNSELMNGMGGPAAASPPDPPPVASGADDAPPAQTAGGKGRRGRASAPGTRPKQ